MVKKFVNQKGEIQFVSEKDYCIKLVEMLNAKGFKEVFTNE